MKFSRFFKFTPILLWGFIIKKFLLIFLLPLAFLGAETTYETSVDLRGFSWGTSIDDVVKKMGKPASREEVNGLSSLLWENIEVNGYLTYMIAYFSRAGLQGGTYYFITKDMEDDMRCYSEQRQALRDRYGPTFLYDGMIKELRPYESSWNLPGGYVYLMVNTRQGDPVTLWYSSPTLTAQIFNRVDPVSKKR